MKLLFFMINLNLGGTEKSFLNLVHVLPKSWEIDVILLENKGLLLEQIPANVNVTLISDNEMINDFIHTPPKPLCKKLFKKSFLVLSKYILLYTLSRIKKRHSIIYDSICYSKLNNIYDYAVAFAGPHDFITYYIINHVSARTKIQWIHFDLSSIYFSLNEAKHFYPKFDKIVSVTEVSTKMLIQKIDEIQNKTITIHNFLNKGRIIELSKETVYENIEDNIIKILTVGRLTHEKGHHLFIPVVARLKEDKINFIWYIIGEGTYKPQLLELINMYDVADRIVFLGSQLNPYKFLKYADIYLQPSLYEGYCITIAEAKILNLPIIATTTAGTNQIINNKNGLLVNTDEESIYTGIKKMLDIKLRSFFKRNLYDEIDEDCSLNNIRVLFDF